MFDIPLFDSLSHPTLSGDWFNRGLDATFETLVKKMREASFVRACAVGMSGHEGYEHVAFAERCRAFPQLVPVAGVSPKSTPEIDRELDLVRDLGFYGIKLHPRLSNFSLDDPRLVDTFNSASRRDLPVFLCTYFHTSAEAYPQHDPLYALAQTLKAAPKTRLVLLHGGTVELMRWMQFVRHMPNVLLDISFTMMRYRGASLDSDLAWLFDGFQNRTCTGTDHPEWSHAEVTKRFAELSAGANRDAVRKIGGLNLAEFLGIDL